MPRIKCTHCGADDHVSWDCRKKSTAATKVSPQAAIAKRSLTGVSVNAVADLEGETTQVAGTQALPVEPKIYKDTRKGSRHAPGYMAQYMRDWRKGIRRT